MHRLLELAKEVLNLIEREYPGFLRTVGRSGKKTARRPSVGKGTVFLSATWTGVSLRAIDSSMEEGRFCNVTSSPLAKSTARRTTFRSFRRFPFQA